MSEKTSIHTTITLNDGRSIPQLGLGVWQIPNGKPTENAVSWALDAGYRHIDTATFYHNESSVGHAIKQSKISRDQTWVTTKLWPTDYLNPRRGIETSLQKLGLEYVDLYLIHWPVPGMSHKLWRALEGFVDEGLCRSIGVSNYSISLLEKVLAQANIPPAVNQVNCSAFTYPQELHDYCIEHNIALEAYSPLTHGRKLHDEYLTVISEKHGKTNAQILLRWAIQKELIVIPKSANKARIDQNADIFDFVLSTEDMQSLDALSG